ncbi:hypothetical protein B0J11DRAFT_508477 [Dendryphion nanum]|uniref:Uncharacterized protein n=1 Tax=Dendryphion nanum TaxID=256645 RepID=A0A9P9IHN1_9PLEO|nr:hypothetical protein B0J11DRAFT_508477 [Dendryphion nanum]
MAKANYMYLFISPPLLAPISLYIVNDLPSHNLKRAGPAQPSSLPHINRINRAPPRHYPSILDPPSQPHITTHHHTTPSHPTLPHHQHKYPPSPPTDPPDPSIHSSAQTPKSSPACIHPHCKSPTVDTACALHGFHRHTRHETSDKSQVDIAAGCGYRTALHCTALHYTSPSQSRHVSTTSHEHASCNDRTQPMRTHPSGSETFKNFSERRGERVPQKIAFAEVEWFTCPEHQNRA